MDGSRALIRAHGIWGPSEPSAPPAAVLIASIYRDLASGLFDEEIKSITICPFEDPGLLLVALSVLSDQGGDETILVQESQRECH